MEPQEYYSSRGVILVLSLFLFASRETVGTSLKPEYFTAMAPKKTGAEPCVEKLTASFDCGVMIVSGGSECNGSPWWSSDQCAAEIVRQHLANVVVLERSCSAFSKNDAKKFYCAHTLNCKYRVVSEGDEDSGKGDTVFVSDLRSVVNRGTLLQWGGSTDEESGNVDMQLHPVDVFGGDARKEDLIPLGGGKSGAKKFMSPDRSVIFKTMEDAEYGVWRNKDDRHQWTFEGDLGARFDMDGEDRSYLSRTFGVQSLFRESRTACTMQSRWNVFANVLPGGTNWFHSPVVTCDIKPQEMVGSVRASENGGALACQLCASVFEDGPARIAVEDKLLTPPFRSTRTATWESVESSDAHESEESDRRVPHLSRKNVLSIMTDLKTLGTHGIVDYSWLLLVAEPKDRTISTSLEASLAPIAVLESGHFVFVGVIDYLQPHTGARKLESLVKSMRAWGGSVNAKIHDNDFQLRSASEMQAFKFFEYAQKQFLLASLYFACIDDVEALKAMWHLSHLPARSVEEAPRVCGRQFPLPILDIPPPVDDAPDNRPVTLYRTERCGPYG
eukprot:g1281.t1